METSKIVTFQDLHVWKEGHQLVLMIYKITKQFPKDEMFGLTSQLRRASVSVTSNVAEGFSRQSYKDKLRFYSMSLGSLTEVQNQILVARDVGYCDADSYQQMNKHSVVVHRLLNGLIKKTKSIIQNS